jgi:hypothetical protein
MERIGEKTIIPLYYLSIRCSFSFYLYDWWDPTYLLPPVFLFLQLSFTSSHQRSHTGHGWLLAAPAASSAAAGARTSSSSPPLRSPIGLTWSSSTAHPCRGGQRPCELRRHGPRPRRTLAAHPPTNTLDEKLQWVARARAREMDKDGLQQRQHHSCSRFQLVRTQIELVVYESNSLPSNSSSPSKSRPALSKSSWSRHDSFSLLIG